MKNAECRMSRRREDGRREEGKKGGRLVPVGREAQAEGR
jgi:hypothetical protein